MSLLSDNSELSQPRKIRSFIRRQGRITAGQQAALDNHWDKYCLDPARKLVAGDVFGRDAPPCLEIGFGNGECLAALAADNPDKDYIGIEVHRPGVGHLMLQLEQLGLSNVRIYCHDAIEILNDALPDGGLSAVHLFFPDPWPKKKHHKRRIVNNDFLDLLAAKLAPDGYFHAATDWQHYAEAMLEVLSADSRFANTSRTGDFCERPAYRPLTKFERRGLRLGHCVWDLIFAKR